MILLTLGKAQVLERDRIKIVVGERDEPEAETAELDEAPAGDEIEIAWASSSMAAVTISRTDRL